MIPARAIVAAALPWMTQRNQAVNARPKVKEKIESIRGFAYEIADIDIAPGEFGNRMPKHRRLSD